MGSGQRLSLTHVERKDTAFSVLLSSLLSRYLQRRCRSNFWLVITCVWRETLVFTQGGAETTSKTRVHEQRENLVPQPFFSGCYLQIFFILKIKSHFVLKELICSKCQCSLHARSVFLQVWSKCERCGFPGPSPSLQNQSLWGWHPGESIFLTSSLLILKFTEAQDSVSQGKTFPQRACRHKCPQRPGS